MVARATARERMDAKRMLLFVLKAVICGRRLNTAALKGIAVVLTMGTLDFSTLPFAHVHHRPVT